eukprot:294169-Chlamydomonas_euryale.AAC.2
MSPCSPYTPFPVPAPLPPHLAPQAGLTLPLRLASSRHASCCLPSHRLAGHPARGLPGDVAKACEPCCLSNCKDCVISLSPPAATHAEGGDRLRVETAEGEDRLRVKTRERERGAKTRQGVTRAERGARELAAARGRDPRRGIIEEKERERERGRSGCDVTRGQREDCELTGSTLFQHRSSALCASDCFRSFQIVLTAPLSVKLHRTTCPPTRRQKRAGPPARSLHAKLRHTARPPAQRQAAPHRAPTHSASNCERKSHMNACRDAARARPDSVFIISCTYGMQGESASESQSESQSESESESQSESQSASESQSKSQSESQSQIESQRQSQSESQRQSESESQSE